MTEPGGASFVVRYLLAFSVGFAGVTAGIAFLLPGSAYLLIGLIFVGIGVFGKALIQSSGGGRMTGGGGTPAGQSAAIGVGSGESLQSRTPIKNTSAAQLYYAFGLIS